MEIRTWNWSLLSAQHAGARFRQSHTIIYWLFAVYHTRYSNCTSRSLLSYPARSLLSLVRFLYGSSGFPLVGGGSHPPCIHLHYLLWNYTCTHILYLSWRIPIYVFEPLSSRWSLCVIALIPSPPVSCLYVIILVILILVDILIPLNPNITIFLRIDSNCIEVIPPHLSYTYIYIYLHITYSSLHL